MLKKTLPYYVYQIDAIESWLDEQARSGLFLLELRLGTMRFRQDTPKPMRYRIDVKRNRGYTGEKERIAAYAEMGWEYVCDLTPQLDIYCCADPDAPELNTDEETLHEVLDKKLTSEQRMGIIGLIFIPIWLYQMMFRNLLQGRDITGFYDFLTSPYVLLYPAILLLADRLFPGYAGCGRHQKAAAADTELSLHRTGAAADAYPLCDACHAGRVSADLRDPVD